MSSQLDRNRLVMLFAGYGLLRKGTTEAEVRAAAPKHNIDPDDAVAAWHRLKADAKVLVEAYDEFRQKVGGRDRDIHEVLNMIAGMSDRRTAVSSEEVVEAARDLLA